MTKNDEGRDRTPQPHDEEHVQLSESAQDMPQPSPEDEASGSGKHGRPTDDSDPGHS